MAILDDYKSKVTVFGDTKRDRVVTTRINSFLDSFKNAPEYEQIKIQESTSTDLFDSLIYSNSSYKQFIEEKTLILAPEQNISNFFSGQYVFPQRQGGTYILTSFDTQYEDKPKGRMEFCNQTLKWMDENGEIHSFPCVLNDRIPVQDFDGANSGVPYVRFLTTIKVQLNPDTLTIDYNDRFIFGQQVFEVTAKNEYINDEMTQDLLELTVARDETRLPDDDFVNGIAGRDIEFTISIDQDDFDSQISATRQLTTTITKNDIIDNSISVNWSSSDESIATVDSSGLVTMVANGTTNIRASINDFIFDEITITVEASPSQDILYDLTPATRLITQLDVGATTFTARKFIDGVEDNLVTLTITDITQNLSGYTFVDLGSNQFSLQNNSAGFGTVTIQVDDAGTLSTFDFELSYF